MNMLIRDAWVIFKRDLKIEKYLLLVSLIFMGYLGVMIGVPIEGQLGDQNELSPIGDILLLTLIPMLGFYFSKKSFKYLTEDSYTQMLVYLRSLPISPKVIMSYRYIQMFTAFIINGVIFFSIMYGISDQLRLEMSIGTYICFALTWIGYALAISGIFIHLELMYSGRRYFWLSMALMGIVVVIGIIIRLLGGNLLLYTVRVTKEWGILSPVMWGALVIGILCLFILGKFTLGKLQNRNLL